MMDWDSLVQIFGAAGATFFVMWQWLKSVLEEKKDLIQEVKKEQEARVKELKEVLPLLTEASKGLQDVLSANNDQNLEMVELIKIHMDSKVKEITEKCKSNKS